MTKKYGWTPREINDLTPYQAFMYYNALTPEDGEIELSPQEYEAYFGPRDWITPGDSPV